MNDDIYKKYKLAGTIASEARDYGVELIKPGISFEEIANKIEKKILENKAGLAFPVNISVNEIAAHYSPITNDKNVIKKGDVVKLDLGAHIDGYIADTAITVEVEENNYEDMINASSDALDEAINTIKPGINLFEIGKNIQEIIKSYGFNPIDNLTGHSMEKYNLHAGMSVPNVFDKSHSSKPKPGDVFAIEPFSTNGQGHVKAGEGSNIYLCKKSYNPRLIRNRQIKIAFEKLKNNFNSLPFAHRWTEKLFNNSNNLLRRFCFLGLITHYPQLVEARKGIVTQKEHTVIITEKGCEVIT
jgi:methionyl aminopeptidase